MTNVCLNFKIEEYKLNLNRLIEGSLLVSKVLNTQWATKRLFINQQRLKWRWKLEFLCLWTSSVMKVRLSHIKCWHLSISYFKSVIYMLGLNFILIACMQAYKCVTTKQCGFFCLLGRDQKIETKLGCENIMSQNTIVQQIGLIERLRF